ncbi:MAG: M48 family metalloprotease [Halobacteriales archaeon]
MDPLRKARLSLVGRMVLALGAVAVAAAVVGAVVVVVGGTMGWIAVAMLLDALAEAFSDAPLLGAVFKIIVVLFHEAPFAWAAAAIGAGYVVTTVRHARQRLRTFHADLLENTEPVDDGAFVAREVRRLAQQADVPVPAVRTTDSGDAVSYVVGRRSAPTVVVSRGVLEQLSDDELSAVLAHEVGHLANRDTGVVDVALVPLLAAERWQFDDGGPFGVVYRFAQVALALLTRGRELAADTAAARLTGSPEALASALVTLEDRREVPTRDARSLQRSAGALNIVPPVRKRADGGLLDTYPPLEVRLDRLEDLAARQVD